MAYQALYRMYRPTRFDEVIGQTAVVRILRNQVITGRIGHAYLFSGPRGVGKTSLARIFARAINCTDPQNGEACGRCGACPVMAGGNMDILEIDAASNNSVDDIRELRENVGYAPAVGRYRVYIIDEVHMLSASAFNALLKTLEEPPAHGVFILATTQPQKLPDTVLSRCQRFDFTRIPVSGIAGLLRDICRDQGVTLEERGLLAIARAAEGGLRDALSLLDQCIAAGGDTVTAADVYAMMGTADQRYYAALADAMLSADTARAFKGVDGMFEAGVDVQTMATELMRYFRDLFVVISSGAEALETDEAAAARYRQQAQTAAPGTVLRILEILSSLESDLRYAGQPRVLIELAVARCCRTEKGGDYTALLERIERLEAALSRGVPAAPEAAPAVPDPPKPQPAAVPEDGEPSPWQEPDDIPLPDEPPWAEDETEPSRHVEPAPRKASGPATQDPPAVSPEPVISAPAAKKNTEPAIPPPAERTPEPATPGERERSGSDSPVDLPLLWNRVMAELSAGRRNDMLISLMQQARPAGLEGNLLEVAVPPGNTLLAQRLNSERNSARLARCFGDMLGRAVRVQAREERVAPQQLAFIENSMRDLSQITGSAVTVQFDE